MVIDNKLIKFKNTLWLNVITDPLPPHPEGNVNAISTVDFLSPSFPWKAMLWALAQQSHIVLKNMRALGFDLEDSCNCRDRHALFDYGVLRA